MALVKCPECFSDISEDATFCPHCGKPIKEQKSQAPVVVSRRSGGGFFGTLIAIILAFFIIWYVVAPKTTPKFIQQIGGTINAIISGEDGYTVYTPKKGK